jgi:3-hydroxybutyryl-CoA dehydratase
VITASDASFKTESRAVTAADVEAFADLTGDHHPVHVDDDWAAGSIFGERIAHGMLVLSCGVGLTPLDPDRVVALRRCDATFKAPVRLGDAIRVEGEVVGARTLDDAHSLVTATWRLVNQDGKTVVRATVETVCRGSVEGVGQ